MRINYIKRLTESSCWPWFPQIFVNGESTSASSTIMRIVESNTLQHCTVNIHVETIHSRIIGIVSSNRLVDVASANPRKSIC